MWGEESNKEPPMTAAAEALAGDGVQRLSALAEAVSQSRQSLPALLAAARKGDGRAFAALIHEFEAPTYHFILRLVRRPAVAEDVSQEVFVRLWRHLDDIESVEMLQGWLRRVAANAVIDYWRKEEARERRMQELREHPIARHVVRPSTRLESKEALDAVRGALDGLPAKLKSVLLLRTIEGLSYQEVADVLGLSIQAVRSRLFRARQEVLESLKRGRAPEYLADMYRPGDAKPRP